MPIDFKREFGVNAGYVEDLFRQWSEAADAVDPPWRALFERMAPRVRPPEPAPSRPSEPEAAERPDHGDGREAPAPPSDGHAEREPLRGLPGRIAENMRASLEVPTATSVRTIPVKVLDENRRIVNGHLRDRALGKASYTHFVAFALVRALRELPTVQHAYEEIDGKAYRVKPRHVNLGLAIDLEVEGGGRALVVPNIKEAEALTFRRFLAAYEDVVARARAGTLEAKDFQNTTVTLTNPGGFGTVMSVPRLLKGQGLIVAIGAIGVPPENSGMSRDTLAASAVGPVMAATSTYDHRVVQGAESAIVLRRMEELLRGKDDFYGEIFRNLRVPWQPWDDAVDQWGGASEEALRDRQAQVWSLINAYRIRGCRLADLDPLEYRPDPLPSLDPAFYGFTIWDLDRTFLTEGMGGGGPMTLRDILQVLRETYCRRWTIEFMHVTDRERKQWLRERVEVRRNESLFEHEDHVRILTRLYRAQNFERFLHKRYVGNKRFSLEGADTLIPALAELIDRAAAQGVESVVIGMAHRGRLNVLANILNKSYAQIFREFEGVLLPLSSEGSSDVKYHLGQRGTYTTADGREVQVILSANPSHLEAVDPVVCGMTRGYQDRSSDADRRKVLSVLIHGDAAFSGQGVVAETFNMSELRAYHCGGTIHVVVNNQIGFTAGPEDLRSTYYCTDVAKSIQAPILHANGDYPEAVLKSVRVAVDYQREFGASAVIDMVCYRRWGHNEGDEPAYTQPVLYSRIREHPTVVENYVELLVRRGKLTRGECEEVGESFDEELHGALESTQAESPQELTLEETLDLTDDDPADWIDEPSPETGVAAERLVSIIERLNRMPDGFVAHPNLLRQLHRRERMVSGEQPVDWGCAEALAFGALVEDGVAIRMSGQDSGRGTFSQRHAVIRDQRSGAEHLPLASLAEEQGHFEVYDSLLSEEAVVGFEYGYSVARPDALVLWEAQFGDFVNGAQIPIDQFVVAGEAKWKQIGGLVLLLPHGFDGQGPEHSSARPERFLEQCSAGNLCVANCTTSAQYFHLLQRQGRAPVKRPLVVLTPKSLLRDKRAASDVSELATGRFLEVIGDAAAEPARVRRVLLCSGKVYYDLAARREEEGRDDVAVVRLEQLYPFPRRALSEELDRYGDAELVWVQEEPRNMGARAFVQLRLGDLGRSVGYAGRPDSASPATGSYKRHAAEQSHLVLRAFATVPEPAPSR